MRFTQRARLDLVVAASSLVVAACGGIDVEPASPGPEADEGTFEDQLVDVTTNKKTGNFWVFALDQPGFSLFGVTGSFERSQGAVELTENVGPCRFRMGSDVAPTSSAALDAGAIDVRSGGEVRFTATMDADSGVYVHGVFERLWEPGSRLRIVGHGGPGGPASFPAFSTQILSPTNVTLVMPALSENETLEVDRGTDFVAEWTDGRAGDTVNIHFLPFLRDENGAVAGPKLGTGSLICSFPAQSGRGVVPRRALALLPPGDGSVSIGTFNEKFLFNGRLSIATQAGGSGSFDAVFAGE